MHPFESHLISEMRREDLLRAADQRRLAASVPRSRFHLFRRARHVENGTLSRFPRRLLVGGRGTKVTEAQLVSDQSVLDQIVAATVVPKNGTASWRGVRPSGWTSSRRG